MSPESTVEEKAAWMACLDEQLEKLQAARIVMNDPAVARQVLRLASGPAGFGVERRP